MSEPRMPNRTRLIRPSIYRDGATGPLSADTRDCYLGLATLHDDEGWGRWRPEEWAATLYPYEPAEVRLGELLRRVEALVVAELIELSPCGCSFMPRLADLAIKGGTRTTTIRDFHASHPATDSSVALDTRTKKSVRVRPQPDKSPSSSSSSSSSSSLLLLPRAPAEDDQQDPSPAAAADGPNGTEAITDVPLREVYRALFNGRDPGRGGMRIMNSREQVFGAETYRLELARGLGLGAADFSDADRRAFIEDPTAFAAARRATPAGGNADGSPPAPWPAPDPDAAERRRTQAIDGVLAGELRLDDEHVVRYLAAGDVDYLDRGQRPPNLGVETAT